MWAGILELDTLFFLLSIYYWYYIYYYDRHTSHTYITVTQILLVNAILIVSLKVTSHLQVESIQATRYNL